MKYDSPQFPPVLFSCLRFLNSADPTIWEPGTGYLRSGCKITDECWYLLVHMCNVVMIQIAFTVLLCKRYSAEVVYDKVSHQRWLGIRRAQPWLPVISVIDLIKLQNGSTQFLHHEAAEQQARFSLRILVVGERCNITREYLKKAPRLNKK